MFPAMLRNRVSSASASTVNGSPCVKWIVRRTVRDAMRPPLSGAWHERDALRILHRREQRRDRLPELRMYDVRRELGEREQHEPTLVHLGMRNLERALLDDLLIAEEDVEIDDARAPALARHTLSAHRLLDGLQPLQ